MNILKIKIYFGISIILKYNYLFEELLINNIFDEIHVSLDKNILIKYRETFDEDFYLKYYDIMKLIFINNKIIISDNQDYESIDLISLKNRFSLNIKYSIIDHIINNKNKYNFEYITLSTKVLNALDKNEYEKNKYQFFNTLNKYNNKIILLGEQNIKICNEYTIHKTYSIYDDCIKYLNNYIDNTILDTGLVNDIEHLLESFDILNKSKLNIFISCAGISVISLYTSNNIIGLTLDNYDNNDLIHIDKNINLLNNLNDFLFILDEKINIMN